MVLAPTPRKVVITAVTPKARRASSGFSNARNGMFKKRRDRRSGEDPPKNESGMTVAGSNVDEKLEMCQYREWILHRSGERIELGRSKIPEPDLTDAIAMLERSKVIIPSLRLSAGPCFNQSRSTSILLPSRLDSPSFLLDTQIPMSLFPPVLAYVHSRFADLRRSFIYILGSHTT